MENQEKRSPRSESNDIDLSSALVIIGKGFRSIGRFFSTIFNAFANAILYILLFLKRRMWWLLGAVVVGLGLGAYINHLNGTRYYSVMTAKYNFGSTRALYNTIDYLNALIGEDRVADLSKVLSISIDEARSIKQFSAHALDDEKVITDLYNEYYLASDSRTFHVRTDTFWTRTIKYKDFKEGLTKYDIPHQQLVAYSNRSDIFPKIQQALINIITASGTLKKNEQMSKRIQEDDERMVINSIQGLDTLRQVYNERLRRIEGESQNAASSVTVLDKSLLSPNPELALYDKFLQFKDELRAIRNTTINNQEIVQVSASFNPVGKKLSFVRQSLFTTTLQVVILTLIILLFAEVYKALGSYEKKKRNGVSA